MTSALETISTEAWIIGGILAAVTVQVTALSLAVHALLTTRSTGATIAWIISLIFVALGNGLGLSCFWFSAFFGLHIGATDGHQSVE